MSDIYLDRENMERRMGDVVDLAAELDVSLRDLPAAADGGPATALLGFIAAAGAEAANEYSGAVQLIGAITSEIMRDAAASEEERSAEIQRINRVLEG